MAELKDWKLRPHRRWNPLIEDWILVSPQRTQRPWQGETTKRAETPAISYDPTCYLCPGNKRAGGQVNPQYTGTFAFDNDYPALLAPDPETAVPPNDGLIRAEAENGRCRVVCFHPNHSLRLSEMQRKDIEQVIQVWADETTSLGAQGDIAYVQIFENRGSMMGASNPHPHCQIWATGHIPDEPAREGTSQLAYYKQHGRTLLADYLKQELADGSRLVVQNDEFVAVVPFWAVWPFETLILPRTPVGGFPALSTSERKGLADVLKRVTMRYDNLFQTMFPYTMGFHQKPVDGGEYPEWDFHAHFYPPLLRSAEIRKFMVGFEMLGMPQRDITPETAAQMLRDSREAEL